MLFFIKLIISSVDDTNPKNNDGETPLHLAAKNKHFGILDISFKIHNKYIGINSNNQSGDSSGDSSWDSSGDSNQDSFGNSLWISLGISLGIPLCILCCLIWGNLGRH